MCAEIDQTREAALLADPALPEPLTTRIATNPAAARAYDLWNMGQILFALLGPGAGSGRNFCNRVGVNSIRSLDAIPPGRVHRFSAVPADRCIHAKSGDPGRDVGSPDHAAYRCLLEDIPGRRPSLHAVSHGWLRAKPPSAGSGLQDRLTAGSFLTIACSRDSLRSPTGPSTGATVDQSTLASERSVGWAPVHRKGGRLSAGHFFILVPIGRQAVTRIPGNEAGLSAMSGEYKGKKRAMSSKVRRDESETA